MDRTHSGICYIVDIQQKHSHLSILSRYFRRQWQMWEGVKGERGQCVHTTCQHNSKITIVVIEITHAGHWAVFLNSNESLRGFFTVQWIWAMIQLGQKVEKIHRSFVKTPCNGHINPFVRYIQIILTYSLQKPILVVDPNTPGND